MAWNDTFTNSTDWSALSFVQMFYAAYNERRRAMGDAAASTPALGQDVQLATFWSAIQGWIAGVGTGGRSFIKPTTTLEGLGSSISSNCWTFAGLMTAIGSADNHFRRKRPREINSTSATNDTQGNAIANGMRAIYTGDGLIYLRSGGAWALDLTGPPDTLDSDSAAPNTVAAGLIVAGDYIGPWIFNQIRDALNLLVWTHTIFGSNPSLETSSFEATKEGSNFYITGTGANEAAGQADADTDYGNGANRTTAGAIPEPTAWTFNKYSGGTFQEAQVMRTKCNFRIIDIPTFASCDREIYVFARTPPSSAGSVFFDDQGDDVLNSQWHRIVDFGIGNTSATAYQSLGYTGTAVQHTWPSGDALQGWELDFTSAMDGDAVGVLKWNVAGGFTYVP